MKKMLLICLVFLLSVLMLTGCGQSAPAAAPQDQEKIYAVPDSTLAEDEYDPHIYGIDPEETVVEIQEEEVPLAPTYVDVTDGVSEREAEAIAIYHAGLTNEDVRFLHSRYVAEEAPFYYHVEFRYDNVPYKIRISVASGEVLLFEKGQ